MVESYLVLVPELVVDQAEVPVRGRECVDVLRVQDVLKSAVCFKCCCDLRRCGSAQRRKTDHFKHVSPKKDEALQKGEESLEEGGSRVQEKRETRRGEEKEEEGKEGARTGRKKEETESREEERGERG
eukprot:901679-Rhodomonas_salina.1